VSELEEIAAKARYELGDDLTEEPGNERREMGRLEN
jgi:hypothetical protein